MALVTANQFQLTPNIGRSISQGLQVGEQFRQTQLRPQIEQLRQQALSGDAAAFQQLGSIDPASAQQVQSIQSSQAQAGRLAEQDRFKSVIQANVQAQNLPIDKRLEFFKNRRVEMQRQNKPTQDTDEQIGFLEAGNLAESDNIIKESIRIGREFKLLDAAPVAKLSSLQQKVAAEGLDPNSKEGFARAKELNQRAATDPSLKPTEQQILAKANEGQLAAAGFANRVNAANENIEKIISDPNFDQTSIQSAFFGAVPGGNIVLSEQQQQFNQSKRDFITAVLRKESGAAIGVDEFANEDKKFFPQIGDKPGVLKQKALGRKRAFENLKQQSKGVFDVQFKNPQLFTGDTGGKIGRFTIEVIE